MAHSLPAAAAAPRAQVALSAHDEKCIDKGDILRIKLNAELPELKRQLAQAPFEDPLTEKLRAWVTSFQQELKTPDLEEVFERFVGALQELLRDPIRGYLDEKAVLGSDHVVYGWMTYQIFCKGVEEKFQNRSPLHPDDPTPLKTEPYQPAGLVIQWLKRHGKVPPPCVETQATYERICKEQAATPPASGAAAAGSHASVLIAPREAQRGAFRDFLAREMQQMKQESAERSQERESLIAQAKEKMAKEYQSAQAQLKKLESELELQEQELQTLEAALQKVQSGVQAANGEAKGLLVLIQKTRQAIEENQKKKNQLMKVIKIVVVVGVCVFATWALSSLISGSGCALGVAPATSAGKGLMVKGAVIF